MKRITIGVWLAAAACLGVRAEYSLEINRGKYPAGVVIESLNGNVPDQTWYKNGWSELGWSGDNYGTAYNVVLSPSHMDEGTCENALTLPSMEIEEGEWLIWEGCEVYPVFSDTYTVEIRPEGESEWAILGEYTESESIWHLHMIDLNLYAGTEAQMRFVCRSSDGYMLALNGVRIKKPTDHSFSVVNDTQKFFGLADLEDGTATVKISVTNTGLPMEDAVIGLSVKGEVTGSLTYEGTWPTGETLEASLPLPLPLNEKTDYEITIGSTATETVTVGESFAYCTSFKRHLYVDKGTGMWCNACPNGTLAIEELKETYGDAVIAAETHNGDPLANDIDFSWLKYYSIPQLTLNRIQATKGETTVKFESQIFIPTEMGVEITGVKVNGDGSLTATARVSTSEAFADPDRSYRIGYTLTRNVAGKEHPGYYQKNICTLAKQKQYRYLPSRMTFEMCWFPDVTIPSPTATSTENAAFSGIPESLPESLAAGETYECEWTIPMPMGYDSFEGMRLGAYILDASDRTIINSTTADIDECTGVKEIAGNQTEAVIKGIFTIDGRKTADTVEQLEPGLYIVDGKKVVVR